MNAFEWLSEYILCIAALYQFTLVIVFVVFAARIGDVRTLDDMLPDEGEQEHERA